MTANSEKPARLGIGSAKSVRTVLVDDGKQAPEVEENGFIDFLVPFSGLVNASDEVSIGQ